MERAVSTGKCQFCNGTFPWEEMTRHLKSCKPRKAFLQKLADKPGSQKTGIYHLFVEGSYESAYWLHLEIHSDATLRYLDKFLRDIWLECCGHLSAFTIEKRRYVYELFEDNAPLWGPKIEEYDMDIELEKVLRPRIKFYHEYDFGTPTMLALRVVSYYERKGKGKQIQLLARNDPPLIYCDDCGRKKATLICTQCSSSGEGWLCDLCAQSHECDEEMFLPVVNSPRTGECGYTGHSWINMSKTVNDNDPCPCGSGKTYIKCCWIRDALSEKREKSRDTFEDLKEAAKKKVFHSRDEFQRFADDMMAGYNLEPDEDFLGLSSKQIVRLLYSPLEQNSDIVRLNRDISPQLYEKVPIVRNAQIFLSALAEVEPLKATAKGNLPVRFAKSLFDEIDDSRFKKYIRFRSEENSFKVLTLRHILRIGGWIKKEKRHFKLTRRGHNLLTSGFSEQHFYHLLHTFAVKFNWAFQDLYPEFWIIQGSWLFSLFLLRKKAKNYTEDVTLSRDFIKAFPEVALEVDETYISAFEYIAQCFSFRFLDRFCEYFGFVEARREKKEGSFIDRLFVKTSPLFKKYFIWNVK